MAIVRLVEKDHSRNVHFRNCRNILIEITVLYYSGKPKWKVKKKFQTFSILFFHLVMSLCKIGTYIVPFGPVLKSPRCLEPSVYGRSRPFWLLSVPTFWRKKKMPLDQSFHKISWQFEVRMKYTRSRVDFRSLMSGGQKRLSPLFYNSGSDVGRRKNCLSKLLGPTVYISNHCEFSTFWIQSNLTGALPLSLPFLLLKLKKC